MDWIDNIILGLNEEVGSSDPYEIFSHLDIMINVVNADSKLLKGNLAIYQRYGFFETISISNEVTNKKFILAHELGHALLDTDMGKLYYNPLTNKGRLEREANYFATKLLYSDLDIQEGIETKEQLSNYLNIGEDYIDYIIEKK